MMMRKRGTDIVDADYGGIRRLLDPKSLLVGALVALVPSVGAAWAFATIAADYVLSPHLAGAKTRVQLMCVVADRQNRMLTKICSRVGGDCASDTADLNDLVLSCRNADK